MQKDLPLTNKINELANGNCKVVLTNDERVWVCKRLVELESQNKAVSDLKDSWRNELINVANNVAVLKAQNEKLSNQNAILVKQIEELKLSNQHLVITKPDFQEESLDFLNSKIYSPLENCYQNVCGCKALFWGDKGQRYCSKCYEKLFFDACKERDGAMTELHNLKETCKSVANFFTGFVAAKEPNTVINKVWVLVNIKSECVGHGSYIDVANLASHGYEWDKSHPAFFDGVAAYNYIKANNLHCKVHCLDIYEVVK